MTTKYKLVPVEPTRDMERAAESYWNERRFKGLSDDPRTWAGVYQAMLANSPDVAVPEIIEAVADFVGSQKGGPFTPSVIKAAIIGQLKYGDAFTKLFTSPVPTHSQQSEEVGVLALVETKE